MLTFELGATALAGLMVLAAGWLLWRLQGRQLELVRLQT